MPYTFGGATSDLWNASFATNAGASSTNYAVFGWFKPTTLTAGRGLWKNGGLTGALAIHTTTSDLALTTDRATTDSVLLFTGVGFVVDVWQFIAVVTAIGSAGAPVSALWIGTVETAPLRAPIIATLSVAGSGGGSTSAARCIGNTASPGTAAFQGQIGQMVFVQDNNLLNTACLPIETAGAFTAAAGDLDTIYDSLVMPLWRGEIPTNLFINSGGPTARGATLVDTSNPVVPVYFDHIAPGTAAPSQATVGTTTGAVFSLEREPRQWRYPATNNQRRPR